MDGDTLARGGKTATFGPAKVSQEAWDRIWADEDEESKVETPNKVVEMPRPKGE